MAARQPGPSSSKPRWSSRTTSLALDSPTLSKTASVAARAAKAISGACVTFDQNVSPCSVGGNRIMNRTSELHALSKGGTMSGKCGESAAPRTSASAPSVCAENAVSGGFTSRGSTLLSSFGCAFRTWSCGGAPR